MWEEEARRRISIFYAIISISYAVQFIGVALKLHEIGASGIIIGTSYLLFNLAAMIGSVITPRYLYKFYHILVAASLAMIATSCYIVYIAENPLTITVGFVLTGMFYSVLGPALTYLVTRNRRDLKTGVIVLTIPQNLGWSVGFLMGALSCLFTGVSTAILISSVSVLLALPFSIAIIRELREVTRSHFHTLREEAHRIEKLKKGMLLPYYVSVLLTFLAASTFFTSLPPLLATLGLTTYEIYFARFIGSVVATLSYVFTISAMLERVSVVLHKISYFIVIRGVGFLLLLTAFYLHGLYLFLDASLILVLIGVTWSYLNTGIKVIVLNFGEEAHKIYGDTTFLICLGFIIGSFLGGALLDLNMLLIPLVSSSLAFIAAGSYMFAARRALVSDMGSIITSSEPSPTRHRSHYVG
ncbi:MAG: MFS transporter [Crenarchaeota archaeon]|nr:MFS transporter [Thermoproteota archaeon]